MTRLKVTGSLSGSDPVSTIAAAVSSAVAVDAASAIGARFVWVTVHANAALSESAPSLAVTMTALDGAAPNATVPLTPPVVLLIVRPAGNPVALKLSRSPSGSLAGIGRATAWPSRSEE